MDVHAVESARARGVRQRRPRSVIGPMPRASGKTNRDLRGRECRTARARGGSWIVFGSVFESGRTAWVSRTPYRRFVRAVADIAVQKRLELLHDIGVVREAASEEVGQDIRRRVAGHRHCCIRAAGSILPWSKAAGILYRDNPAATPRTVELHLPAARGGREATAQLTPRLGAARDQAQKSAVSATAAQATLANGCKWEASE